MSGFRSNDQFHWGTRTAEIDGAARKLRTLDINPVLMFELEAKVARMRTIEELLRNSHVAEATSVLSVRVASVRRRRESVQGRSSSWRVEEASAASDRRCIVGKGLSFWADANLPFSANAPYLGSA